MRILEDRFCNLSRAKDFQKFLKSLDSELYQSLINHLQLNEGCSSNKLKMKEIYKNLNKRGKKDQLLKFVAEYYPHMVVKGKKKSQTTNNKNDEHIIKQIAASSIDELYEKMNYHKVFDIYRPKVLFIPQRRIFVGPTKNYVEESIHKFTVNKLDVDYLVLQGPDLWHGYVEYFESRFRNQIKDVQHNQRPISKYKRSNGIK